MPTPLVLDQTGFGRVTPSQQPLVVHGPLVAQCPQNSRNVSYAFSSTKYLCDSFLAGTWLQGEHMLRICAVGIPPQHGSKREPFLNPQPGKLVSQMSCPAPLRRSQGISAQTNLLVYLIFSSHSSGHAPPNSCPVTSSLSLYLTNGALVIPRGCQFPFQYFLWDRF